MPPYRPNEHQHRIIKSADMAAKAAQLEGREAPSELVLRMTQEAEGANSSLASQQHTIPHNRPTIFLDIDDVLALNIHYGGRHVQHAASNPGSAQRDLYEKIFSATAVRALNELIREFNPRFVLTTSWLSLLQRKHFIDLFCKTSLEISERTLHPVWDAQQDYGTSRMDAIERWLKVNHQGEPIVVIDDYSSGEGLVDSLLHDVGRVVFCEVDVGFNPLLLQAARNALQKPFDLSQPWAR